jgi:hypothetical protein
MKQKFDLFERIKTEYMTVETEASGALHALIFSLQSNAVPDGYRTVSSLKELGPDAIRATSKFASLRMLLRSMENKPNQYAVLMDFIAQLDAELVSASATATHVGLPWHIAIDNYIRVARAELHRLLTAISNEYLA